MATVPTPSRPDAFSPAIDGFADAWRWMVEVLFTAPRASLAAWATWGVIILLSSPLGGGGNLNVPAGSADSSSDTAARARDALGEFAEPMTIAVIVALVLVAVVLGLLWVYLTSRFRFVLLEGVLAGEPRVRGVFGRTARLGGSYFLARCGIFVIALVLLLPVLLVWIPVLFGAWRGEMPALTVALVASLLWFIPVVFAVGIFDWWLYDFVLPCAWGADAGLRAGLKKAWDTTIGHPAAVVVYAIARFIASIVGALVLCCCFALTCAIWIWPVLLMIALAIPSGVFPPLLLLTLPILLGLAFFIGWIVSTASAPIVLLWRAWSVAFLQRLDPSLPSWKPSPERGAMPIPPPAPSAS